MLKLLQRGYLDRNVTLGVFKTYNRSYNIK